MFIIQNRRRIWRRYRRILFIIASFILIVSLPGITLIRFAVWLVIGLVVYFLYSQRHSRLQGELAETPRQDIA